jgi:hypothetical protein
MMKLLDPVLKLLMPPPPKFHGVMGIFYFVDDAADAVRALRQAGHRDLRVYSPIPYHEIEHALEQGPSIVRWVTFVGGVTGFTAGLALCIYTCLSYPLVVGGKELVSLPPFMVISYESMILLAGLTNLLGMLALTRLPEIRPAAPYDPRFSEDRVGIWVPCEGDDLARVEKLMGGQSAEEVQVHG